MKPTILVLTGKPPDGKMDIFDEVGKDLGFNVVKKRLISEVEEFLRLNSDVLLWIDSFVDTADDGKHYASYLKKEFLQLPILVFILRALGLNVFPKLEYLERDAGTEEIVRTIKQLLSR